MSGVVIRETVRRHFSSIGYWTFVALLSILALGIARFDRPGAVWPSLVAMLAIITGCGVIGPEFSSGTLQLILVKPIDRASYLLSRVAGVVLSVWTAALFAFAAESVGRILIGKIAWLPLVAALLNALAATVLTVSLLALLGSLTRAYYNVAIYVGAMFAVSFAGGVLRLWRAVPQFVFTVLTTIENNLYPEAPLRLDRDWLLLVLSNAAIALLLACIAFRRREVPYGAD